jgi:putative FmdB family regulatory protein
MPIYEYECRKCHAQTEVMQKMTDKPLAKCAKCGGRLDKQWSSTSFQLKGTGWYVTDYAAKKSEAKSETKEVKTSSTEDKTIKADSKPNKSEDKSTATKSDTTTSDKSTSSSGKKSSKNATSNTSSD